MMQVISDIHHVPAAVSNGGSARATVVIAHQHQLYLDSLVRLFGEIDALQLVGCAHTEEQLIECVSRSRPEIVIFEPFQPHPHGLAALKRVRAANEATRALVILQTVDPVELLEALQGGAWGYFSYDTTPDDITRAVQVTRRGELWIKRGVMQRLLLMGIPSESKVMECPHTNSAGTQHADSRCELSRREREVAMQVAAGLCNKRIATSLRITESTVKAHLVSIFRKLDIQNRTQLARYLEAASGGMHASARGTATRNAVQPRDHEL